MTDPVPAADDERADDDHIEAFKTKLAQAVHESEIDEVVWQVLICAYLDHPDWHSLAEAVFEKHGYTPEEIRLHNDGSACPVPA